MTGRSIGSQGRDFRYAAMASASSALTMYAGIGGPALPPRGFLAVWRNFTTASCPHRVHSALGEVIQAIADASRQSALTAWRRASRLSSISCDRTRRSRSSGYGTPGSAPPPRPDTCRDRPSHPGRAPGRASHQNSCRDSHECHSAHRKPPRQRLIEQAAAHYIYARDEPAMNCSAIAAARAIARMFDPRLASDAAIADDSIPCDYHLHRNLSDASVRPKPAPNFTSSRPT